ncbi:hypothetical protein LY76DRAFT_670621 [Colletotrichum caudatum]|nr:hypothetical protein LY76DRAFT_670621 [Colletotrichum caudatum]
MREAQCQRDAVLEAITVPGQANDVLHQLRNGETLNTIYKQLKAHGSKSPATRQLPDSSNQIQSIKEEPSLTATQNRLRSPQIPEYSNTASFESSETSSEYISIENQGSTSNCKKYEPEDQMSYIQPSTFSNSTLTNGIYEDNSINYAPTMPSGMFMEQNTPLTLPNAYYPNPTYFTDDTGNISWWNLGVSDPVLPDYSVTPSTNSDTWPYPHFTEPQHPRQAQDSHPQTTSAPSPVSNKSSPISSSTYQEKLGQSVAPSTSAVSEHQCPTPSLTKKRKFPAKDQVCSTAPGPGSGSKSNDSHRQEKAAKSKPSALEPSSCDRERHRRASARNWRKQKQQMADLEAAMKHVESRNRELHREYTEVLGQVMDLKNALMDHAKCNNPEINSWLRSQATKYVMNKSAAMKEHKDHIGAGNQGTPSATAGHKANTCR